MKTVFMTHKATPDYVGPLTATVDPSQIDEWKLAGWEVETVSDNMGGAVIPMAPPAINNQFEKRGRGRPSKS
jgi:hypothetical protein